MPDVYVTNFNPRFTGVSSTAANVLGAHLVRYDMRLVGVPLPGCPDPITYKEAKRLSRTPPEGKPFSIWHVRRNPEMRLAIWARDVLRLPIKIVFTSASIRLHSAYPRWLISKMDAVIATSPKAAEFVPNVKAINPHGADVDLWHPAEDRAASWKGLGYGGEFGIASVGRVRPEKGSDLFVESMIEALPKLPGGVALVMGRAAPSHQSFVEDLKKKVKDAGLEDRILFIGEIPAKDVPTIVRSLSLMVHLPRYEPYGMTPLEGMASGVPFVGSDTGYYRPLSCEGATGRIVPTGEMLGAAKQVVQILQDKERWAAMAAESVTQARTNFSIQGEADGAAAVYEELWRCG
jgi:mannosyltransferase